MEIILTAEQVFTIVLLIIGFILSIFYIAFSPQRRIEEDPSPTWPSELRLEEYENLHNEVTRRERSMIMMGSIFIPVCFLLMGTAASAQNFYSRLLIVVLSTALYSVWLFTVQLTTWILAEKTYPRLRWLENRIGFEVHKFALRKTRYSRMMTIRRYHWLFYMIGLFIAGALIINLPIQNMP